MYITINHLDGVPFEIFVRQDNAELYEWVTPVTVLITRLLREGVKLLVIAKELREMHSPVSHHFIPKGGGHCPSIPARIGMVLEKHCKLMGYTEESEQ